MQHIVSHKQEVTLLLNQMSVSTVQPPSCFQCDGHFHVSPALDTILFPLTIKVIIIQPRVNIYFLSCYIHFHTLRYNSCLAVTFIFKDTAVTKSVVWAETFWQWVFLCCGKKKV